MSDFTGSDRRKFEKLFNMSSGYVLNFTDRTFSYFFDEYKINIDAEIYKDCGTSKANRLRTFWNKEANYTIGSILQGLIQYGKEENCLPDDPILIEECTKITQCLLSDLRVAEIEIFTAIADQRDFEAVAQHIRDTIEKNQPEAGLDRLHTFVIKYIRTLCQQNGIEVSRDKPLHSLFGEYIKRLREAGHLEALMTERILKSNISVLEAFNDVRNRQSLAHDNPILNYEESLLIFNHIAASIRFIKALEARIKNMTVSSMKNCLEDEIPF